MEACAIGSGVLLPGVAENPTFPSLRALAYTTGLGLWATAQPVTSKPRAAKCFFKIVSNLLVVYETINLFTLTSPLLNLEFKHFQNLSPPL